MIRLELLQLYSGSIYELRHELALVGWGWTVPGMRVGVDGGAEKKTKTLPHLPFEHLKGSPGPLAFSHLPHRGWTMQNPLHIISPTQVAESLQLRESGLQRLLTISATDTTAFQFALRYTDGDAIIRISVHPVKRSDSHHPFYDVKAQYETSHPHQPIEDSTIEHVQYVYDTYIQAIRWTFDSKW